MFHREVISRLLSRSDINIFDELVKEIEAHFNRSVGSIQGIKDRDNKKKKGDLWEFFCKDWLLASGKYQNVWLLQEFNQAFGQNHTKQDNGIDLIAKSPTGWVAVQCKYRGKGKYVDWKSLSTFIGLCERTGPWENFLIVTNCTGITRKLPKSPKDMSICKQKLRNTTREHWMRMVGTFQPRTLNEGIKVEITNLDGTITITNTSWSTTPVAPKSLEELRALRLAKFSQNA